jgi:hypothetical protein
MGDIDTKLAIIGLHKDVKTVLCENVKEGVKNLPEPMKVLLAHEEDADVLEELAKDLEEKEDFDKDDLLNLSAVYFMMAMVEEVLDEFENDEEETKTKE